MQHQYWVTKKCVLQKLGGKEDECIVASDAELDAKLELFRSVADNCLQLQRAIDIYQEKICALAQEENALGRYLKEAGKNEKNKSAGQLMTTAGKALAYTGHQRLTLRSPLVRLHHEVETFRGRAISDSKVTIQEMEKARTEYRAALSWMKAASSQLDPDTGHGLEKFRKAQSQVRASKVRFDRLMLACLQKVDLLAAARCNMFSHALVLYQNAISTFANKAGDTLKIAASCLTSDQPLDICTVSELIESKQDQDQKMFFNADYSDKSNESKEKYVVYFNYSKIYIFLNIHIYRTQQNGEHSNDLLIDDMQQPQTIDNHDNKDDNSDLATLLNINWQTNDVQASSDLLGDFLPSQLLQSELFQFPAAQMTAENLPNSENKLPNSSNDKGSAVSWLSLFADLDPLANNNSGSV